MSANESNENNYPFSWLDEVVEITLNPEKNELQNLKEIDLKAIRERLPGELAQIHSRLKHQAFQLYSADHLKVVAGQYDQAIKILQLQAKFNLAQYDGGAVRETGQMILDGLNDLDQNLRHRYSGYLADVADPDQEEDEHDVLFKVLCTLSVDQIAIILKAADDVKLLVARSFSLVLRTIVPFLSTERMRDFSWKSARSSTYKMEGNDKEVAIQALQALIDKIREY